jgi:hypothetical protein
MLENVMRNFHRRISFTMMKVVNIFNIFYDFKILLVCI